MDHQGCSHRGSSVCFSTPFMPCQGAAVEARLHDRRFTGAKLGFFSRGYSLTTTQRRRANWHASVPDVSSAENIASAVWADAESLSAASGAQISTVMSIDDVMKILPHRYPFLLVDKVVQYEPGKRAVAVKNVTVNEPFFQGHFPDRPIMPGVLQIEALAQTGGIVMRDLIQEDGNNEKRDFFFGGVDNVRWRKPVLPGDTLYMEVTLDSYKARFGIAKLKGKAYVDGQLACEANLTLVVDVRGKAKS